MRQIVSIFNLLEINVGSARGRKRVILIASCLINRKSHLIANFLQTENFVCHACPETFHPALIEYRLLCLLTYSEIKELFVIAVEGSPYCITLHFIADEIKRKFLKEVKLKHFTVDRKGIHEISPDAVKIARHLLKIEKLLKKYEVDLHQ